MSYHLKRNRTLKLDFWWINRCVIRFPCDRESRTVDHCGHWAHMGPMVISEQWGGLHGIYCASTGHTCSHGQHLCFFTSPSHATPSLLIGRGENTTASKSAAQFWQRLNLRERFKIPSGSLITPSAQQPEADHAGLGRWAGSLVWLRQWATRWEHGNRFTVTTYRDPAGKCYREKRTAVIYNAQPWPL